ncbi:hypothetical protein D9756_011182 [Leucocoprinus leucothites]|uniref:non-specific serine/threonine protein kinase n=1 Tax=Leucocoprinus leucothites TaxID=201217 RepID=A0A8H5CNS3_9AGAR|nr:hypothetical protein D9756_011182 [Leucoagaricus leucothites]
MSPPKIYRITKLLDTGCHGIIFHGVEDDTNKPVAIKKVRVSQRVKRPILRYESQVHQILHDHPVIPILYGYIQHPHFEYLSMELLGPSIRSCVKGPVAVNTATRVVEQMLSVLEHIHKLGFIHRDIKPANILLSLTDPSKIKLIDFGIARPLKHDNDIPSKYGPLSEKKHIVGTLDWASLNAHNGIGAHATISSTANSPAPIIERIYSSFLELASRDDLESLAYTAFFILRGNLPWKRPPSIHCQSSLRTVQHVKIIKAAASGDKLGIGFPLVFGYLLEYSLGLEFNQIPDYEDLNRRFAGLGDRTVKDAEGPLDWTPVEVQTGIVDLDELTDDQEDADDHDEQVNDDIEEEDHGNSSEEERFSDSYFNTDIELYDLQNVRDKSLTLQTKQAELAKSGALPEIGIIERKIVVRDKFSWMSSHVG